MTRSQTISRILQCEGKITRLKRERVRAQSHGDRIKKINDLKGEIEQYRQMLDRIEDRASA